jgi:hypothetical protein
MVGIVIVSCYPLQDRSLSCGMREDMAQLPPALRKFVLD